MICEIENFIMGQVILASSQWSLQVNVLAAGFPCISLSPLTTTPGSVADEGCSSGHGFHSIMRYIRKNQPELVLMENIQTLFHQRKEEGGIRPSLERY